MIQKSILIQFESKTAAKAHDNKKQQFQTKVQSTKIHEQNQKKHDDKKLKKNAQKNSILNSKNRKRQHEIVKKIEKKLNSNLKTKQSRVQLFFRSLLLNFRQRFY